MSAVNFFRRIDHDGMSALGRAAAILWWAGQDDPNIGMNARDICAVIEGAGHPVQNKSRLEAGLKADTRFSRAAQGSWKLHPRERRAADDAYAHTRAPAPPPDSDSVLPRDLFTGTRTYIVRVVEQINKSCDASLFDCTAVMCRRLVETLIIEVYEHLNRASDIKDGNGNFYMLNGLLSVIEADTSINMGRNARLGLDGLKKLGDLSAHNRRWNARQDDINRVRDGLRVASEELLTLAGMH